jgi:hypothetical protein
MNIFDRICACMALVLGVVLMALGILGIFKGCNAHFYTSSFTRGNSGIGRLGHCQADRSSLEESFRRTTFGSG